MGARLQSRSRFEFSASDTQLGPRQEARLIPPGNVRAEKCVLDAGLRHSSQNEGIDNPLHPSKVS